MGCDIHLHTEVKIGGVWHHYSAPNVDRNYAVFTKMANVRNHNHEMEIVPLSDGRGIPFDASMVTWIDCRHDQEDWHSHSWLSKTEIIQLCEWIEDVLKLHGNRWQWYQENFGTFFGTYWRYMKTNEECDGIPPEVEDVRWVFWFDN